MTKYLCWDYGTREEDEAEEIEANSHKEAAQKYLQQLINDLGEQFEYEFNIATQVDGVRHQWLGKAEARLEFFLAPA